MKESDQLATSFITPYGIYCYVTMLFGLKNAGATYQRTMQKCLADQIGRNIHAYVDDIAVMSKKQDDLIADLQETFNNLRKYNMMLNPTKCVFGVPAGQLLGFIVSHRGIEVNPEKIKAILEISRPNDLKDVQRHRLRGSSEQIHQSPWREGFATLQADEEIRQIRLD
jgi:hypothetical protein